MRLFFLALIILFGLLGTGVLRLGDLSTSGSRTGSSLLEGLEYYSGKLTKAAQSFSLRDWAREREASSRGAGWPSRESSADTRLKLGGEGRGEPIGGFFSKIPLPDITSPGGQRSESARLKEPSRVNASSGEQSRGVWNFGGLGDLLRRGSSKQVTEPGHPDLSLSATEDFHEHEHGDRQELENLINSL